jgi:hypothetical protein
MSVLLNTPFPTVEDTAKELGVSKARLKRLMRLAGPIETGKRSKVSNSAGYKFGNNRSHKTLATAKRRKQTRGKAKKVAR